MTGMRKATCALTGMPNMKRDGRHAQDDAHGDRIAQDDAHADRLAEYEARAEKTTALRKV
jgi:hypothetical protein